jgi:hypothetical protein
MQTRLHSAIEAVINVLVGYGLAIATQAVVFPLYGLKTSMAESLSIGVIFTGVSLVRSYALRRMFNRWHLRKPS